MLKIEKKDLESTNEFIWRLIDVFEDFLQKRGVDLHNDERDENEHAAIIYGSDYGDLYLGIETLILHWIDEDNENGGLNVDILLKQYDKEREHTRVYHSIDPNSLVIQGKSVYFAHPDCWLSGNCANRYRIEIGGMDYLSSDPEDIERAMQDIPEMKRGLCVSSRDRDLSEAICEAAGGPVQPEDGDGE